MDPDILSTATPTVSGCPEDALLRRLLLDELAAPVAEGLARHLESCGICRGRLDLLAGVERVVPAAGSPTPAPRESPALRSLMIRLQDPELRGQLWASEFVPVSNLEILSPPVHPGALGRFAGYDVLERIASGGMGVVFKAREPALDRVVAIKVLAPALATSPSARARFLREARAAAAISHEHVVAIHAVGEDRGLPFLVMPFIAGRSLETRLQQGPLELVEILRIGSQIARGLAAAHAQGLIHRDVKPGNILLENGVERVKLTDFGLARAVDEPGITRVGVIAGTPEYMSPEQARGERVDPRSDLFGLGCVLYAMATGRSAFAADSTPATLKRVCDHEPPQVQEVNARMPVCLGAVIARLMAKQPEQRGADAATVAESLERSLRELQAAPGGGVEERRNLPRVPGVGSSAGIRIVGVGVLVFALVAIALGWIWGHSRHPQAMESSEAPFRVLKAGAPTLGFTQLEEAILRSTGGSILELAFDGPRETAPVSVTGRDLVLRAAKGHHPILVNRVPGESLLRCDGSLTLEGLEFRAHEGNSDSTALLAPGVLTSRLGAGVKRERLAVGETIPALIQIKSGEFIARNCRFVLSASNIHSTDGLLIVGGRRAELTRCEFYCVWGQAVRWRSVGDRPDGVQAPPPTLAVSQCLFVAARPFVFTGLGGECQLTLQQNTMVASVLLSMNPRNMPTVVADRNIFAVRTLVEQRSGTGALPPGRWQERQNLFSNPMGDSSPVEWMAGKPGPESRIAQINFHERLQSTTANPRRMTPLDFQITAADAAGTPDLSLEFLQQHGCPTETVGPGAPFHLLGR